MVVSPVPGHRLEWALAVSLAINAAVWMVVAAAFNYRVVSPPIPVEMRRIVVQRPPVVHVKPKLPEPVKKPPPPPPSKPIPRTVPPPPPQQTQSRVLTAPAKIAPPKPGNFAVPPGGNHKLGAPVERQGIGDAPDNPPKTTPPTAPTPPPPAPVETPKPEPPAPKPAPPPPPPPPQPPAPKPKGPTQDAQPTGQVQPDIPDDVKNGDFKAFVRVKVSVAADGSFTVTLRSSSGNKEVDNRVLQALNKWKWKPALKDGEPVDSESYFRFNFEVH